VWAGLNRTGLLCPNDEPFCHVREVIQGLVRLGHPVEFAVKHLENLLAVREIEIFVKMQTSFTFAVTWCRRTIHTPPEGSRASGSSRL
jgi:hypothetical protein